MEKFKGDKHANLKDLIARMKKTEKKDKEPTIHEVEEEEQKKDTLTKETMERIVRRNSIIGAVS